MRIRCPFCDERDSSEFIVVGDAGCPRLWADVWDWNVASRRVLEKLAFREVSLVEPISIYGQTVLTVRDL